MKRIVLVILAAIILPMTADAQMKVETTIDFSPENKTIIPKEIYGQFAEHLGSCIYGGLWVGPDSEIPNIDGYRCDVLQALNTPILPAGV